MGPNADPKPLWVRPFCCIGWPLGEQRRAQLYRTWGVPRWARLAAVIVVLIVCCDFNAVSQDAAPDLHWAFSAADGGAPVDAVHGIRATLHGSYLYVPGVTGEALRFDGYTTSMSVAADSLPSGGETGFAVDAWLALNTYPWNWVAIADQEKQRQAGFFVGIDAFGHLGFEASVDGRWQSVVSTQRLPLKRWAHVAGSYRTDHGRGVLAVYLDGVKLAERQVSGTYSPAKTYLLIGRVRQPVLPFPEAEVKPAYPVWYSLDGELDELRLSPRGLSDQEVGQLFRAVKAPQGEVLPWQRMPSGSAQPGKFGAYYTTLRYEDSWDHLRRLGDDSDVVVRFDNSPNRLVFWQGLNYVPAWVSGDDKWYTDEFLEVWNAGCPDSGDCEPMSDKQARFSRVNILESNSVRAVIHWRYALVEAVNFKGAWPDPETGWFDWADEYWTVYPDGIAVRKQVLHSGNTHAVHEWQETIVLHQPGRTPEEDIRSDAVTLENMNGEVKTYNWRPHVQGTFADPLGPPSDPGLSTPNIQLVNLKSPWRPFQIVPPEGASADFYNNEKSYFTFECWNHWPVAQIASSDRPCVTDDRPSHSSLSHLFWNTYAETESTATKLLMDGLTTQSPADLLPLARSWIAPPEFVIAGNGGLHAEYDPTQRAYVVNGLNLPGHPLAISIKGSPEHPVFHPAILLQNWGETEVRVEVNGSIPAPGTYRVAHRYGLEQSDVLLWFDTTSAQPVQIKVSADTAGK